VLLSGAQGAFTGSDLEPLWGASLTTLDLVAAVGIYAS
jgi:hypothetical protein